MTEFRTEEDRLIKAAAAWANADLGLLEPAMADGIVAAEMTDLSMERLGQLLDPGNMT